MMRKALKIPIASLLLFAFTLFNLGMPVVFYLCPLMSSESPICDFSPVKTEGSSLTNQIPDCCAKIFVAERKTTPFVKIHDELASAISVASTVPAPDIIIISVLPLRFISDPDPPGSSLFLLNSSLLL